VGQKYFALNEVVHPLIAAKSLAQVAPKLMTAERWAEIAKPAAAKRRQKD